MMNWKQIGRLAIAPVLALGMAASLTAYHTAKPVVARAAAVAPSATPLDDNSVSPLLALDQAMETLAARVTPAIVNVAVTSKSKGDEQAQAEIPDDMRQFFGPGFNFRQQPQGPQIEHGIGSGVIISPDGYIVTNNHVVDGAVDVRVTMSDRRVLPAKVIGTDPLTDLAVIKVEGKDFPNVPWGDATKLAPGTDGAGVRQPVRSPLHGDPRNRQRVESTEPFPRRRPQAGPVYPDRRSH